MAELKLLLNGKVMINGVEVEFKDTSIELISENTIDEEECDCPICTGQIFPFIFNNSENEEECECDEDIYECEGDCDCAECQMMEEAIEEMLSEDDDEEDGNTCNCLGCLLARGEELEYFEDEKEDETEVDFKEVFSNFVNSLEQVKESKGHLDELNKKLTDNQKVIFVKKPEDKNLDLESLVNGLVEEIHKKEDDTLDNNVMDKLSKVVEQKLFTDIIEKIVTASEEQEYEKEIKSIMKQFNISRLGAEKIYKAISE